MVGHPRGARELWADTFLLPRGKLHHGIAPGDPQPVDPPDQFQHGKGPLAGAVVSPALDGEHRGDRGGAEEGNHLGERIQRAVDLSVKRPLARGRYTPLGSNDTRQPEVADAGVNTYNPHFSPRANPALRRAFSFFNMAIPQSHISST